MAKIDCQIGVCPFFLCGMIVVAWSIMLLLRTHTPDSCKGIISRTLWGNSTEFHSFQKHGTGTWISQMFDADWGQNSSSSADNGHDLQKLSHYCLDVSSGFKWRTKWMALPICVSLSTTLLKVGRFVDGKSSIHSHWINYLLPHSNSFSIHQCFPFPLYY